MGTSKMNAWQHNKGQVYQLLFLCLATMLFKMLPHLPNFSPEMVLMVALATWLPWTWAIIIATLLLLFFDGITALLYHYPVVGVWTLFNDSAYWIMIYYTATRGGKTGHLDLLSASAFASVFFWVWTNFGVWLTSGMYAHTMSQLGLCYFMALPFLVNALFGACFFSIVCNCSANVRLWSPLPLRERVRVRGIK